MQDPNEKEKTLSKILHLKEEIWEARSYISSDFCCRCSEMYAKIAELELELANLQNELNQNECT